MNNFPPELLIYALIFIGILLFNYLIQRIAKWQKQKRNCHGRSRARATSGVRKRSGASGPPPCFVQ